jgi:uncharacterized protein YecE (DUF72 family)
MNNRSSEFDPDGSGRLQRTGKSSVSDLAHFLFRSLHPDIFLGTASDRYAGWIGQIYRKEKYGQRIDRRPKIIKGKTFSEAILPVDSLEDYFEHFSVLEIDYTFYRPLTDEHGKPTPNFFLLKKYGEYLKEDNFLFLKVPQSITARKIHQGPSYVENDSYLNPYIFTEHFYKPALHLLGSRIKGFIFEQEYHRQSERLAEMEMVASLDLFFKAIPRDNRYHLELRTETYWQDPLFDVLEKYGVGQILSHWTWLPPLEKQFNRADRRFFNAGKQAVIRLMTPLGLRYEEAYEKAFPFDKIVEGMLQPRMIDETVRLMHNAIKHKIQMNIIINNRSGGSAPLIARQLAEQFLKENI